MNRDRLKKYKVTPESEEHSRLYQAVKILQTKNKKYCFPSLTKEAVEILTNWYLDYQGGSEEDLNKESVYYYIDDIPRMVDLMVYSSFDRLVVLLATGELGSLEKWLKDWVRHGKHDTFDGIFMECLDLIAEVHSEIKKIWDKYK